MKDKKDKSTFDVLSKVDVNKYKKKKGKFDYLSWAWAVTELLKVKPEATWHTHEYEVEGRIRPYMVTEAGFFCQGKRYYRWNNKKPNTPCFRL